MNTKYLGIKLFTLDTDLGNMKFHLGRLAEESPDATDGAKLWTRFGAAIDALRTTARLLHIGGDAARDAREIAPADADLDLWIARFAAWQAEGERLSGELEPLALRLENAAWGHEPEGAGS